ncbi:MAG: tRNA 2-thiouridine(34) synthase MnmA [Deltaproteobacteria bacterium HGW-Deltaproteobacteria-13]|jgi:tRNA-specific 2-thiouridylase|nr:MAG: tRNA 2-thiouridine(34) synthase MnmA [Deltaproteobacteria bacterium HGW-Deltaproteobacteria-13]
MGKKVLVAMSGGIDSSVAAMLLKNEGYDVSGVTMCFGIATEADSAKCCGADAIDDAKRVCDRIKIPHYVFDYASQLEDKVIANFISEYKKGRTPNPCVVCNCDLKFGNLLEKALMLGFDFLATGHYAVIEKNEKGYCLKKPKDKKKDQTYFLYSTPYEKLKNILFPLAGLTKDEVREIAKKASLPVAEKPESQDICFVTQKNYQEFISGRVQNIKPGPIVDMRGKVLGKHRGIMFYTIGQRGGLGISHPTPLYVVSIDPDKNSIVAGEKKDLRAKGLVAGNLNLLVPSWPDQVYAKIRYRKKEAACEVEFDQGQIRVLFAEEQEAVTPGQSVVFYDHDCVLGGGIIDKILHVGKTE